MHGDAAGANGTANDGTMKARNPPRRGSSSLTLSLSFSPRKRRA